MIRDKALITAFADELRSRRVGLGVSQEELAHRAGLNRTYVAKLELATNQPTLTALHLLAQALGKVCRTPAAMARCETVTT